MNSDLSRRVFVGGTLSAATLGLLAACTPASSSSGTATIRYQFFTTQAQGLPDAAVVAKAMNTHAKKHGGNFAVKLDPADLTTFTKRMPLDIAAGQAGDVMFASSWVNLYTVNASQGNFLALDDLLPKHAPKLWASLPTSVWDATRVNGKIYGVPNQQLWPYTYGFLTRKDMADKYGLEPDSVSWYNDLDPFLAELKGGESGKSVLYSDNTGAGSPWAGYFGKYFDGIGAAFGAAVRIDDKKLKVVNMFESDEFREACELARKWYTAGYYATNPPSTTDAVAAWNNGQTLTQLMQVNGNGLPAFATVGKNLIPAQLTTGGIMGSLSVVNADAKEPEAALAFIESLITDKDFFRLMAFGIEGKHYVVKDASLDLVGFPEGVTAENSRYNLNLDWQVGDQFNAYYRDEGQAKANLWEQQKKTNESAKPSVALGFTADTDPIKTDVANVSAAVTEFRDRNALGLVDPTSGIKDLVDRMNSAGMDRIITELQKQVDKWGSSK